MNEASHHRHKETIESTHVILSVVILKEWKIKEMNNKTTKQQNKREIWNYSTATTSAATRAQMTKASEVKKWDRNNDAMNDEKKILTLKAISTQILDSNVWTLHINRQVASPKMGLHQIRNTNIVMKKFKAFLWSICALPP